MKSVLVICTRNRPKDVFECLSSVVKQSQYPSSTLIVDSSDNLETETLCRNEPAFRELPELVYSRSNPGLTVQRNRSLELIKLNFDVVHFIDDDVILDPDYIANLNQTFLSKPEIVGAGGMVLGGSRRFPRLSARLGLRDSKIPGVVLASGYNIGAHETKEPCFVDWLPGCSMSYRLERINGLFFDESRVGYALGEDVDFGLRASGRGLLQHVPEAKLVHKLSPVNRVDVVRLAELGVIHRWKLAKDFPKKVKRIAVVYASLNSSVTRIVKSLVLRDKVILKCAIAEIATITRCVLGGK